MSEKKKFEETAFYIKGKRLLEKVIEQNRSVDDLGMKDEAYQFIRNSKVRDENGRLLTTDEKFAKLGHERNGRASRDLKQELYDEIAEYLAQGGSFHVARKSFPFYSKLRSYANHLKSQGIDLTHEEIIRDDLGFVGYSDLYFRSLKLFDLKNYRDADGFVDSYRNNKPYYIYCHDLATSFNIPSYILVTLIADEKLKECFIQTDRIGYVKTKIDEYINQHGSLVGLRTKAPETYESLRAISADSGDGSGEQFTRQDMLDMLGFGGVQDSFIGQKVKNDNDALIKIMHNLKQTFGNQTVRYSNLTLSEYELIQRKAVHLGVSVRELFETYGINYNGKQNTTRLSRTLTKEIPYLNEMRSLRDEMMHEYGGSDMFLTEEDLFELKVEVVKQVYAQFKDKIENLSTGDDCESQVNVD